MLKDAFLSLTIPLILSGSSGYVNEANRKVLQDLLDDEDSCTIKSISGLCSNLIVLQ
jgi:hypothetical protein